VGRQYTGSAGKITNCQTGVFAAYVSDQGHADDVVTHDIAQRLRIPVRATEDGLLAPGTRVPGSQTGQSLMRCGPAVHRLGR
jgi:hypothetical protein